jgi:hypothetical protein
MDKLLDVSRQGGYPWCAETAEALNQNANLIERFFCTLAASTKARTAVILDIFGSPLLLCVCPNIFGRGARIATATTNIPMGSGGASEYPSVDNLLNYPDKYALKDVSLKISPFKEGSTTEVYPDAVLQERYEIVFADNNNQGWTFRALNGVIAGTPKAIPIIGDFKYGLMLLNGALLSGSQTEQFIRVNALNQLEVNLWIRLGSTISSAVGTSTYIVSFANTWLESHASSNWLVQTRYGSTDAYSFLIEINRAYIGVVLTECKVASVAGENIHISGIFPL